MHEIVPVPWGHPELEAAGARAGTAGATARDEFERALARSQGYASAQFVSSGRVALTLALKHLGLDPGAEVVLPSFLCPAVVEGVVAAGMVPVLCDVDPLRGRAGLRQITPAVTPRTGAVVLPQLFGIHTDNSEVQDWLTSRGVDFVEDRAHLLTTSPLGSRRAPALVSFNHDKPMTLGGGGALLLPEGLPTPTTALEPAPEAKEEISELEAFLNWYGPGPRVLRTPLGRRGRTLFHRALARLGLGHSARLVERFRGHRQRPVGAVRAALGVALLRRYGELAATRNRNASILLEMLRDDDRVHLPELPRPGEAFLRLPVLLRRPARPGQADQIVRALRTRGYGATRTNWPMALHQRAALAHQVVVRSALAGAERFAADSLTLPIHHRLEERDMVALGEVLREALGGAT